jgi:hypothetical protein
MILPFTHDSASHCVKTLGFFPGGSMFDDLHANLPVNQFTGCSPANSTLQRAFAGS